MRPNKPALIFLAAVTAMGLLWGGDRFFTQARSSQVYVADCHGITYKPIVITKSCSSTLPRLSGIEWESWDRRGATAKAIYLNGSDRIEVTLSLEPPVAVAGKFTMHALTVTPVKGQHWSNGSTTTQLWKLGA